MSLAVYPGSFDPLTLGHVDIAARAATLFDIVVIGIAHNAVKAGHHLLDVHERLRLTREATTHLPGVEVDIVPGLLADYCSQRGANAIIKGLRNGSDLDAELPMALLTGTWRPGDGLPDRLTRLRAHLLLPRQGRRRLRPRCLRPRPAHRRPRPGSPPRLRRNPAHPTGGSAGPCFRDPPHQDPARPHRRRDHTREDLP